MLEKLIFLELPLRQTRYKITLTPTASPRVMGRIKEGVEKSSLLRLP
jgi:hypothetical protein